MNIYVLPSVGMLDLIDDKQIINIAIAIGIGLLIGAERERSHLGFTEKSLGGVRTFTIASIMGALSAYTEVWLFIVTILVVTILTIDFYARSKNNQTGIITEISLILTVILGGVSIFTPGLAVSVALLVTVLLSTKDTIHEFVLKRVSKDELNDFLVLSAATLIILPLIPDHLIGPYDAINPRHLWLIVIFILLISMLSNLLLRLFGAKVGLPLTGFISGFISSIATVSTMAAHANEMPEINRGAVSAVLLSCTSTIIQLCIILLIVSALTLKLLFWPLLIAGVLAAVVGLYMTINDTNNFDSKLINKLNTGFRLNSAFILMLIISLILLLSAMLMDVYGTAGLVAISAISGIVDVHAQTIAVATLVRIGQLNLDQASVPILIAFTTNAMSKIVIAILGGPPAFWKPVTIVIIFQILSIWFCWYLQRIILI